MEAHVALDVEEGAAGVLLVVEENVASGGGEWERRCFIRCCEGGAARARVSDAPQEAEKEARSTPSGDGRGRLRVPSRRGVCGQAILALTD
jgi:hypothetical protein